MPVLPVSHKRIHLGYWAFSEQMRYDVVGGLSLSRVLLAVPSRDLWASFLSCASDDTSYARVASAQTCPDCGTATLCCPAVVQGGPRLLILYWWLSANCQWLTANRQIHLVYRQPFDPQKSHGQWLQSSGPQRWAPATPPPPGPLFFCIRQRVCLEV